MRPATKNRILKSIFGGEGPRENERRFRANADLKYIADMTQPWTVEGLKAEVRLWLERDYR